MNKLEKIIYNAIVSETEGSNIDRRLAEVSASAVLPLIEKAFEDYASLRVEEETKKAKSFEELCVSMQQTNEAVIKRMNFLSKTNRQLVEALNEIYEFSLGESDLTFIRDTAHKAILSQFNKEEKV
jgi:hypothetical protein